MSTFPIFIWLVLALLSRYFCWAVNRLMIIPLNFFLSLFENFHRVTFFLKFISSFRNILTVYPPGSRLVFDWNPCTNFSEGFGCKDVLVSSWNNKFFRANLWSFSNVFRRKSSWFSSQFSQLFCNLLLVNFLSRRALFFFSSSMQHFLLSIQLVVWMYLFDCGLFMYLNIIESTKQTNKISQRQLGT